MSLLISSPLIILINRNAGSIDLCENCSNICRYQQSDNRVRKVTGFFVLIENIFSFFFYKYVVNVFTHQNLQPTPQFVFQSYSVHHREGNKTEYEIVECY